VETDGTPAVKDAGTRRRFLVGAAALAALPVLAVALYRTAGDGPEDGANDVLNGAAGEVIELSWTDLVPESEGTELSYLRGLGVVQHGQMSSVFNQETSGAVTEAYDGKTVRIPGYLIPLDHDGLGMTSGLLVPYVGACIHVPPPPPNQLIFVTSSTPYESSGLFEPVWITGTMETAATETQLAEIGYTLIAHRIVPDQ